MIIFLEAFIIGYAILILIDKIGEIFTKRAANKA